MLTRVIDWLEERTGVKSAILHFLNEDIPASAGWHQVLGSVALFAFLTQAFTGFLLALNYAPTPGEAYDSLRYIVTDLTGGQIIRGLHHWGASLMIIVVVLHMTQVFLWGAYKKPRETTWMLGAVLLLMTLAYGLTGYLLPWDNRAYWGTVVTTQIASQTPVAGPYLLRLLGSNGGSIGVVTFARFYAVHVLLLPPLTALLIGIHVYLVRRHSVAPEPGDENLPKQKFYPAQVFKDTIATFVWFIVLVVFAVAVRVPLGHMADPTDISFIPRPEWYFLFLFQLLKIFEGPFELVGTVILPTLAIIALFLVPFIDRSTIVRVRQRTGAIAMVILGAIGWGALTARAIVTTPPSNEADESLAASSTWQNLPPSQFAAIGYFRKDNCARCHTLGKAGTGPDLTVAPSTKSVEWLTAHFQKPDANSAPSQLKPSEMRVLATFVSKRDDNGVDAWKSAPQADVEGAMVYQASSCGACHQLNGSGTAMGPPLNGVAGHRTKEWIEAHFADPAKLSPGSSMPAFNFNPQDLDRITTYLMAIPGK